jgi:hypothetical protein
VGTGYAGVGEFGGGCEVGEGLRKASWSWKEVCRTSPAQTTSSCLPPPEQILSVWRASCVPSQFPPRCVEALQSSTLFLTPALSPFVPSSVAVERLLVPLSMSCLVRTLGNYYHSLSSLTSLRNIVRTGKGGLSQHPMSENILQLRTLTSGAHWVPPFI